MSGAAPAYDYDYARKEDARRGASARRADANGVSVLRPRRQEVRKDDSVSFNFSKIIIFGVAVGLFVGILAICHILLDIATVNVMMENDKVSAQISEIRSESELLEVQKSNASNPTNLKKAAKKLGMTIPYYTETMELEDDVVAYDEDGNLSLSDSLAVAAEG